MYISRSDKELYRQRNVNPCESMKLDRHNHIGEQRRYYPKMIDPIVLWARDLVTALPEIESFQFQVKGKNIDVTRRFEKSVDGCFELMDN